jgi:hypothetical protein
MGWLWITIVRMAFIIFLEGGLGKRPSSGVAFDKMRINL